MDEELEFGEQIDDCIEEAQKEGLPLEAIAHKLTMKTADVLTTILLGGQFLTQHMD